MILSLPIPLFDAANKLHSKLAKAAVRAQQVAAAVQLKDGMHFIRARQRIRAALLEDGIAQEIDELVAERLKGEAKT